MVYNTCLLEFFRGSETCSRTIEIKKLLVFDVCLYRIFKLKDATNLLFAQFCFVLLPILHAFNFRRLMFLTECGNLHSTVSCLHDVFPVRGNKIFADLCSRYNVYCEKL
jgi:hypothetical protein